MIMVATATAHSHSPHAAIQAAAASVAVASVAVVAVRVALWAAQWVADVALAAVADFKNRQFCQRHEMRKIA